MAKDGYLFLVPLAAVTLLFFGVGLIGLGVCSLILSAFVAFFFRDPDRPIPQDMNAIVSPADGKIIRLEQSDTNWILSIFLSIFDVHVNRAPIGGTIVRQDYHPGRFRVAYDDRASVENERLMMTIAGERTLTLSLIAGIVARRICAWKKKGEVVNKGDRIGLIRFGSRVDLVLPSECEVSVQKGDRVYGGSTILAYWKDEG